MSLERQKIDCPSPGSQCWLGLVASWAFAIRKNWPELAWWQHLPGSWRLLSSQTLATSRRASVQECDHSEGLVALDWRQAGELLVPLEIGSNLDLFDEEICSQIRPF